MNSTSRDIPCIDVIKSTWPTFCNNLPITLSSPVLVWLIPSVVSGIVFACLVITCIIFGGTAILRLKLDVGPDQIQQVINALLPVIGIVIAGIALYALTFVVVFNLVIIGWERILLALAGGKPAEFSALFNFKANAKRWFWKLFTTYVLATLAINVGLACFVIPGLFLSARLSLAPFLVIDRDYGPIEAIKKSNELVAGYTWQILLLSLMLNGAFLISALFTKLLPVLGPILLVAIIGFYGLVLAKIYMLRTDGVELRAPQCTPTADPQRDARSGPASKTPTEIVKATPIQVKSLRNSDASRQGNEVLGAVYVVSFLVIIGLGGAFVAGVSIGHKEPAASSGNVSAGTTTDGSTQAVPAPISGSASTPNPVPPSLATPAQPSDYLSDNVPYTSDRLADKFVRFKADSPLGQSKLQLELLAPKDWQGKDLTIQKQDMAQGALHPLELAELECGSPNTSLEAWYMSTSANQPARLDKCFRDYCQSTGFTTVKQNSKPDRIEAIVKYSLKNVKPMLARITFLRVGSNIFWLAGCAPESEFGSWSNTFSVAAASFSPVGYNPALHPDVASRTILGSEVSE